MNPEDIFSLFFFPAVICEFFYLMYLRKIPRVYVMDYKRGLRFVKGAFRDVLGPGNYQPLTRRVQIEIVDMRPVPFLLERIFYRDAMQSDSVVSIGAEMMVSDPYLACTMVKDRIGDSMPVIRDTMRSVLSRGIADASPEFRVKAAEDIAAAVNAELKRLGMKISNVEITELSSRSGLKSVTASPN